MHTQCKTCNVKYDINSIRRKARKIGSCKTMNIMISDERRFYNFVRSSDQKFRPRLGKMREVMWSQRIETWNLDHPCNELVFDGNTVCKISRKIKISTRSYKIRRVGALTPRHAAPRAVPVITRKRIR